MPSDSFISLRKPLRGAVDDLLDLEQMACPKTQGGLVGVIDALSRYREEGRALFPEMYVIDDLQAVLKVLPGGDHIPIGSGPRDATTMAKALKQCAPLARDGWAVYIHRQPSEFSYGIMRTGIHALSVPIADVLVTNGVAQIPALLVRQVAPNQVEVRGVLN